MNTPDGPTDPPPTQHLVFRGWITIEQWGDNRGALFLHNPVEPDTDDDVPLAQRVIMALGGKAWDDSIARTVRVGYLTSDQPFATSAFDERLATVQMGLMEAEYRDSWTEITGYLWTDEHLGFNGYSGGGDWIGGHDIIAELRSHEGRWCHLVIDVIPDDAHPNESPPS